MSVSGAAETRAGSSVLGLRPLLQRNSCFCGGGVFAKYSFADGGVTPARRYHQRQHKAPLLLKIMFLNWDHRFSYLSNLNHDASDGIDLHKRLWTSATFFLVVQSHPKYRSDVRQIVSFGLRHLCVDPGSGSASTVMS